jgi:hypothetical protein
MYRQIKATYYIACSYNLTLVTWLIAKYLALLLTSFFLFLASSSADDLTIPLRTRVLHWLHDRVNTLVPLLCCIDMQIGCD